ncbi:YdeI/OmpD-associated family protein [Paenibacillus tarimensis]
MSVNEALVKKLKLLPDHRALILQPPDQSYTADIGLEPEAAVFDEAFAGSYDFVQLFVKSVADLELFGPIALRAAKEDAMLWICYPKGTSKIKTDINRDRGWETVTEAGMEGIASIAVDETWSALRFRPAGMVKSASRARRERDPSSASGTRAYVSASSPVPSAPPEDLLTALADAPQAKAIFDKLAPSHKKEYIKWIEGAKRAETRSSRIVKTIEKLNAGLKNPYDKG